MSELEAELRRLADCAESRIKTASDLMAAVEAGASVAYTRAADLARDYEAKRGDGWSTMESAPRDVPILVFGRGVTAVVELYDWTMGGEPRLGIRPVGSYGREMDVDDEIDPPTRWRPLPEPPVAEG